MTLYLTLWLIAQAVAAALVWVFTVGLGRRVALEEFPAVAVIVAVKGHDLEFDEFLVRLFEQDYPAFRVIFAVESEDDEAVPAIAQCCAIAPERASLVVAVRLDDAGQKTTNLRAALGELTPADEIVVFADADIWPEPDWLRRLVEPLVRGEAGVVSGFPWLIVKDGRLSSVVLTALAASIATVPRAPLLNAAWGGSTAIRHADLGKLDLPHNWEGVLSDDLQLTNLAHAARLTIAAPREILPRTAIYTAGFGDVIDEVRRWYMLVRVYIPATFALTLGAVTLNALGWLLAILGTLGLRGDAMIVLVLALVAGAVKTAGRAMLVQRLWGRKGLGENMPFLRLDPVISPLAVILNAVCGWSALFMRRVTWAGITYELRGPQEVRVLRRVL